MQKSMDHVPTKISDDAMLQSLNDFGDEQPWAASVIHAYERGIKIGYTNSLGKHLIRIFQYRSGTVNSKSFVGKVLLRIKWKFELN